MRPATIATTCLLLLVPPAAADDEIPADHMKGSDCLAWIADTYRVDELGDELGLDLSEDYATALACSAHDLSRMRPVMPVTWCDNVFKVHCSGLDLLAEVGEAVVSRCEQLLGQSLGLRVREHESWKTCAQDVVFERYSFKGASSDEAACRAALLDECGTNVGARSDDTEPSADLETFVACCSADTLDPERGETDRCGMIDSDFTRGPCHDHPVCVNRLTGDWLSCSE